jgi:hypothetical protein
MKGVVWGSTYYIASKKLDKVVEDYKTYRIKLLRIVKSKSNYWVEFENGDIWRACSARESARGLKANVAYIDHMISPIFIDEVIKPCLTAYPFQALGVQELCL